MDFVTETKWSSAILESFRFNEQRFRLHESASIESQLLLSNAPPIRISAEIRLVLYFFVFFFLSGGEERWVIWFVVSNVISHRAYLSMRFNAHSVHANFIWPLWFMFTFSLCMFLNFLRWFYFLMGLRHQRRSLNSMLVECKLANKFYIVVLCTFCCSKSFSCNFAHVENYLGIYLTKVLLIKYTMKHW